MPFCAVVRSPLHPAALAFVSFGKVLVRVRVLVTLFFLEVAPLCSGWGRKEVGKTQKSLGRVGRSGSTKGRKKDLLRTITPFFTEVGR